MLETRDTSQALMLALSVLRSWRWERVVPETRNYLGNCACTVSVASSPHRRSSNNASHELVSNGCILMQGKPQGNPFNSIKSI